VFEEGTCGMGEVVKVVMGRTFLAWLGSLALSSWLLSHRPFGSSFYDHISLVRGEGGRRMVAYSLASRWPEDVSY